MRARRKRTARCTRSWSCSGSSSEQASSLSPALACASAPAGRRPCAGGGGPVAAGVIVPGKNLLQTADTSLLSPGAVGKRVDAKPQTLNPKQGRGSEATTRGQKCCRPQAPDPARNRPNAKRHRQDERASQGTAATARGAQTGESEAAAHVGHCRLVSHLAQSGAHPHLPHTIADAPSQQGWRVDEWRRGQGRQRQGIGGWRQERRGRGEPGWRQGDRRAWDGRGGRTSLAAPPAPCTPSSPQ